MRADENRNEYFDKLSNELTRLDTKGEDVDKTTSTLNDIRQYFDNGDTFETNREILRILFFSLEK